MTIDTTILKGTLKTWKDDRGFGFIKPEHEDQDVFIHISAFGGQGRRPWKGDVIYYQLEQDQRGKIKAANARIEGEVYPSESGLTRRFLFIGIGLLLVAGAVWFVTKYLDKI